MNELGGGMSVVVIVVVVMLVVVFDPDAEAALLMSRLPGMERRPSGQTLCVDKCFLTLLFWEKHLPQMQH